MEIDNERVGDMSNDTFCSKCGARMHDYIGIDTWDQADWTFICTACGNKE